MRRRHPSLTAPAEPQSGPVDAHGFPIRAPHPDLVNLCRELQGGPAVPMTMPVTQRIAAAWRGPGTWEERFLATMRQCNAEGPTLWTDITGAVVRLIEIEEYHRKEYAAEVMKRYRAAATMNIGRQRLRSYCEKMEEAMGIREATRAKRVKSPAWRWALRHFFK